VILGRTLARPLWPLLLAALALPAHADEAAEIRARLSGWATAFNARDAAAACDLFAPELRYTVPGVTEGTRETMCGNLAKAFLRTDLTLRYADPEILGIEASGDLAAVRLRWTLSSSLHGLPPETTVEEGLDVFRRQPDGDWRIVRFLAFSPASDAP